MLLDELPTELVQLIAQRAPLSTIASLARVCRYTAACVAESSFWRIVAAELGVPSDTLTRIDDTIASDDEDGDRARRAALCEAIRVYVLAHVFDDELRVHRAGIVLSANAHAVVANNGHWNTVMSKHAMTVGRIGAPAAPPRVLCFRVARPHATDHTYRIGVTTARDMQRYNECAITLPAEQLCATGEYRSHFQYPWAAGAPAPSSAFPQYRHNLVVPTGETTPGYVALIVARSGSLPDTAVVVLLVLHAVDEERATVQLCFARRLKLDGEATYSVIATLSGEHMGCVGVVPPRQLTARALELADRGDGVAGTPNPFLEDMHGVTLDKPRVFAKEDGDSELLAFLGQARPKPSS